MVARALIVLLLVLNLGVALWWATRAEPSATLPEIALPQGAERLRLLDEAPERDPLPRSAPDAAAAVEPGDADVVAEETEQAQDEVSEMPAVRDTATAMAERTCYAFGPFADATAAAAARAQLQPLVQRIDAREIRGSVRGWRVYLPGPADRAAAEAITGRLAAAGFNDFYLLPSTAAGTHDIALGRFGSEPAARRHEAALQAAGFQAKAEPLGEPGARQWLDVVAGGDFDVVAARRASGAERAERRDCPAQG